MNSKIIRKDHIYIKKTSQHDAKPESDSSDKNLDKTRNNEIEQFCDDNLTSLQKIHAILLNCVNLSKKQKLDFCESERYFMKLYLKRIMKQKEKK